MASSANDIYVKLQKLANTNTKTTLNFNKTEANTARKWQESMSNTSHQREVKDLIAAGLNPVLSSGGSGAQSYTTSAANGSADNSAVGATANVYSADLSSSRSLQAAQSSAAAVRYSAMMNLKAAQEAASAQRYAADRAYEGVQYSTKYSKSGSVAGIIGTTLEALGFFDVLKKNNVANISNDVQQQYANKSYLNKSDPSINRGRYQNFKIGSAAEALGFYNSCSGSVKSSIRKVTYDMFGTVSGNLIGIVTGFLLFPKNEKFKNALKIYSKYYNSNLNF